MKQLSPIVSKFETQQEAESYDRWFRAKVQASIDEPRQPVPQDEVMPWIRRKLERRKTNGR